MERALTGIQPSGAVHLGNWLGALRPLVELQERYEIVAFVADLHALTTTEDPEKVRTASREIAATLLALGFDPERGMLFRQSAVPEVCELAWILGCSIPRGVLDRSHAVKAALDAGREPNVGTWFYPVLMSADILLYDAAVVPVGQDQKSHVEIARDIAVKVNFRLGEGTLRVPEVSIRADVGVIPGLDGRKMSKSYDNAIGLWEPAKQLRKKVMRIATDSKGVDEPKDPKESTIFQIYSVVARPEETAALAERYLAGGMGYGEAKQALADVLERTLAAPRERYEELLAHPTRLDDVLAEGTRRARAAASVTMERVRSRAGLA
jgi:tryptophanyl-tRNA synthetase